jgi:hypothetical protein
LLFEKQTVACIRVYWVIDGVMDEFFKSERRSAGNISAQLESAFAPIASTLTVGAWL